MGEVVNPTTPLLLYDEKEDGFDALVPVIDPQL